MQASVSGIFLWEDNKRYDLFNISQIKRIFNQHLTVKFSSVAQYRMNFYVKIMRIFKS